MGSIQEEQTAGIGQIACVANSMASLLLLGCRSEQGFLRWYFYYDTYNLPMQYHANAHQHSDLGSNGKVTGLEPILIHFADEKPWQVPESDALYKYATPCNSSFPVKPVSRGAPAAGHHRRRRQHARWSELVNG